MGASMRVECAGCGHTFARPGVFSLYEQQAVEASPCPACARLTLCLAEPAGGGDRRQALSKRRRERAAAALRDILTRQKRPDRQAG